MKIKSAKSFRFWYKTKVKQIDKADVNYNENFVGTYHDIAGGKKVKGFFEMYHGDKPDIAGYLPSILKIAEDGQAIYEFLQNAVDCNSTHFYIFYNEKYFLAINNGDPFDIEGLQSILNIAQTTKKDADKIGRFGIGFKLAHRLVGKNEGTEELVRDYKGPVLFSWSRLEDLQGLLKNEQIEPISPQKGIDNGLFYAPYLLKLILTNFPANPNETVKDLKFNDHILFPQTELDELIDFLKENFEKHSDSLKMNVLNKGSLFFIKLGEGKKDVLDRDYSELVNGIQYSMNTLKRLQKVYINNEDISKVPLQLEDSKIKKGTNTFNQIDPEYKEFDIKFAIGYNKIAFGNEKSYEQIKSLKEQPNFYKYFPMGDEVDKFGFIIHCDSFSNEANRRKLQQDNVNKNLLPEIAKFIQLRLNIYRNFKDTGNENRAKFLNLYACILLSDIPVRENNKWLRPVFYDTLLDYLKNNIPTKNGYCYISENVKINNLKINLDLSDFGLGHIQWFEWNDSADQFLINEAKKSEKLGIKEWDIRDIVENANLDSINNWIANCDNETYNAFLNELENSALRQKTKEQICNIKLFQFSNGKWYAFNDIVKKTSGIYNYASHHCSNVVICNQKTEPIKEILQKLGFVTSNLKISEYTHIYSSTKMPADKLLYGYIAEKCKTNILTPDEKKILFLNFINEHTKFTDVGNATLKELYLFTVRNGEIKPLKDLIISTLETPEWLQNWVIKPDEYFPELNSFLIAEAEIYPTVILNNWDYLIMQTTDIKSLYEKTIYYYGLKESNISLWKKNVKFIYTKKGFMQANQVFFNSKMLDLQNHYVFFQNAVLSLYGLPTPEKSIANYLLGEPFRIDGSNFTGRRFNKTQLDVNEIKVAVQFCILNNNEQFFKSCIISKEGNSFYVFEKSDKFQITSPDEKARQFIDKRCSEKLFVLPHEFLDSKDEYGIITANDLHSKIIDCVDVNDCAEELVDIVKYQAKLQFLQQLSEIRLSTEKQYVKDDYEYKLLELALSEIQGSETQKFRNKIVIESNGSDLSLSDIPPCADKIKIDDTELSLSEILPDSYQNSNILSALIDKFVKLGLPKDKLDALF
ncbi:MAG: ATP-binding protein, partial [Prevotellaceae bacterium]|nr:ATP-binding protein [Prevotellaceae bacterium]